MEGSFMEAIAKHKVSDLPVANGGNVVTVSSTDSLEEGFQKLVSAGILSAPVWNEETSKYTGFLDMRDLVSSVVFIADHAETPATKTLADLFVNAKWVGGSFTVTYLSRRNPFKAVKRDDSLSMVLELLAKKGPGRLKRVAVVDDEGRVVNIVSQTTLLHFLAEQISNHKAFFGKSVNELELGSKPIITVSESAPAMEAFKLMDSKQVTGLAITDDTGKLVGNISARDLKIFIKHIDFDKLLQPVGEFIKDLRQRAIDIKSPTITVFGDTKFEMVIGKLSATKVHRIFVVDSDASFHPERVVSLADVLYAVAQGKTR